MSNLRFSLKPVGRNTVEVGSHRMKYVCQIQATSLKLKAFKDEVLQEQADFRLNAKNHVASLELKDHESHTLRTEVMTRGNRLSTVMVLNGARYQINEPEVAKHGFELARILRGVSGPRTRYIGWFMKDLRNDAPFRQAVFDHTALPDLVKGNTVIPGFCAVACACCGVLIVEPIPGDEIPCCAMCLFCLRYLS